MCDIGLNISKWFETKIKNDFYAAPRIEEKC
jgi:hypothetical protein